MKVEVTDCLINIFIKIAFIFPEKDKNKHTEVYVIMRISPGLKWTHFSTVACIEMSKIRF